MKSFLHLSSVAVLLAGVALFSGCMTSVTVVTDPPGATVYCRGAGRNAYRWQYRGATTDGQPVVFKVPYNAIQTQVIWPSEKGQPATRSDIAYTKLFLEEEPVIRFDKQK